MGLVGFGTIIHDNCWTYGDSASVPSRAQDAELMTAFDLIHYHKVRRRAYSMGQLWQ